MSIAGIILAAGFSRRLGRPKQGVLLDGETLLTRAIRIASGADLAPIFVVLNGTIQADVPTVAMPYVVIQNYDAEEGLASSIRVGIAAAAQKDVPGAVIMTCDQVLLTADHLRRLSAKPGRLTASVYGGRRGVPAYFPKSEYHSLLQLSGDAGARELLKEAYAVQAEELLMDVDTEQDLACARAYLAQAPE